MLNDAIVTTLLSVVMLNVVILCVGGTFNVATFIIKFENLSNTLKMANAKEMMSRGHLLPFWHGGIRTLDQGILKEGSREY